jgi:hypothetical protein
MTETRGKYIVDYADLQSLEAFRNRPCALPFYDPGYEPPTPGEVDALIKLAGWSQNQAAKITGVTYNPKKGSTTIRKWRTRVESREHRAIPYAAWRLMLVTAGLVTTEVPTNLPSESLHNAKRDLLITEDYLLGLEKSDTAKKHGTSVNHVENTIRYFHGIATGSDSNELQQLERQYEKPFFITEPLERKIDGATRELTCWRQGLVEDLSNHYNSTYNWKNPKVRPGGSNS